MKQVTDDAPISKQEARELIERNAGTISLRWYFSLVLVTAAAICAVSLLTSSNAGSFSDYLARFGLLLYVLLSLSALIIIHSKPVSFDRNGIAIGWLWADKTQYDWEEVVGLRACHSFRG